ncbi:MAG: hypothetical protein QW775_00915 [Ignisphaera sp.]|uniref:Uncharacterized protein n=1 Tax=Ignisphaera aggregans TaxID=334771 RepID=A0A7C4JJX6_9CREN
MSSTGREESKRQRYINVFVLVGRENDVNSVVKVIEGICLEYGCSYELKKGFLGNLLYIKIHCQQVYLEDVRKKVDYALNSFSDKISWMKSEVIDVK